MRPTAVLLVLLSWWVGAGGEPARAWADDTVAFRVIDSPSADPGVLAAGLTGIRQESQPVPGRLTWDVSKAVVIDDAGGLIADVKTGDVESEMSRVQGVIDKWTTVQGLAAEAASHPLDLRLEPGDRRYREGEEVTLEITGNRVPFFTLFNLAADGTVNFLYPVADLKDPPTILIGGPYRLKLFAGPPFGADHFIAIASDRALDGLQKSLQELNGKQEASQILDVVRQALAGRSYQIGVHALFSAPR